MEHVPVLLRECIEHLNIKPGGVYVDGTLGRAGHSLEIAKRLTTGRLVAVDKDETAIREAEKTLAPYMERVTLVREDFRNIGAILDSLGIDAVDGMLFDLGVSSPQLDGPGRGFSYMADAPLDMRMDRGGRLSAWDVVNTWPEEELRRILWEYGEERYAGRVAARIVSGASVRSERIAGRRPASRNDAVPPHPERTVLCETRIENGFFVRTLAVFPSIRIDSISSSSRTIRSV